MGLRRTRAARRPHRCAGTPHAVSLGRGGRSAPAVAVTDPAGQETRLGYDADGNIASLRTPDGAESRWSYDSLGRCVAATDAKGNVQRREHDALGQVVRVFEPDGNMRELAYDAEGNVVHARDRQRDVRSNTGAWAALASRSEAGTTVRFDYDTEEQLIAIKNEHGHVYSFELDPPGTGQGRDAASTVRRQYLRDAAGRVKKVIRPARSRRRTPTTRRVGSSRSSTATARRGVRVPRGRRAASRRRTTRGR